MQSKTIYPIGLGTNAPSLVVGPGCVRQPIAVDLKPTASDVDGCYGVGVGTVAAGRTSELRLSRTIGAGLMPTARTGTRCTAWIDEDDRDGFVLSFVLDEVDQLSECPRGHHAVEPLTTPGTVTNAVQGFKDDDWAIVLESDVYDLATELVVYVPHPARLLAFLCLYPVKAVVLLVATTQVREMLAAMPDSFAIEVDDAIWCGHGCQPHNAQIDANERVLTVTDGWRRGSADREHDVPVAATLEDFGITVGVQDFVAVLVRYTQGQPDILTAFSGGDAQDGTIVAPDDFVGIDTKTNALRTVKFWERCSAKVPGPALAIIATSKRHSSVDGHASVISGEAETLPDVTVTGFVDCGSAAGVLGASGAQAEFYGGTEGGGCGFEPHGFAPSWFENLKYDGYCVLHEHSVARTTRTVKSRKKDGGAHSSPG